MSDNCIIIYLDLVGYSKMNKIDQELFFKNFQRQLHHQLYNEIIYYDDVVSLVPTGDGMIITLIEDVDCKRHIRAFDVIYSLFNWIETQDRKFRGAIHCGDVFRVRDINKLKNVIGNSINDASRMLGGVSDGDIVISRKFFEDYLNGNNFSWELNVQYNLGDGYHYRILDEDVVIDKHSKVHEIYSISISKNGITIGATGKILNKYEYTIFSTDYPKEINKVEKFISKIKKARELNFIGIYNGGTPELVNNVICSEKNRVDINIYYAANILKDEIKQYFGSDVGKMDFALKERSISALKDWYDKHIDKQYIGLHIYEYEKKLDFGASTIDVDEVGKGFIHISNYLRNILPENTPYIEMYWITRKMPPLYKFYHDYINDQIFNNCNMIWSTDK